MTLPLQTTRITVLRTNAGADADPYVVADDTADTEIETGVPAHISTPSGREQIVGGSQELIGYRLDAEICDIAHNDRVRDETTDELYEVVWAMSRYGLGLNHVEAGLNKVSGAA